MTPRLLSLLFAATLAFAAVACNGSSATAPATPTPLLSPGEAGNAPTPLPADDFMVRRPLNRVGIGDVGRAFARYQGTRGDLIGLFKQQDWYKDGISRDEALFIERTLSFVARYPGSYADSVSDETVKRKLYIYQKVNLSQGEIEMMLVYEPGQDGPKEMAYLTASLPVIESMAGVQFPEKVLYVINGDFPINDYNDGQFIRIARCCVINAFVLGHELSHSYWSVGPSWFNEGLADIYATLVQQRLSFEAPEGWRIATPNLDSFYADRKRAASRFPNKLLDLRLADDGLYEAADVFLLDIRRQIGEEAFALALRDLYLASDFGRYMLRDKRIEDTFLQYTPVADQSKLMAMFNASIWGDNGEQYKKLKELASP